MYSLDINFLKDRPDLKPAPGPKKPLGGPPKQVEAPLLIGAAVGVALPALALAILLLLNWQRSRAETAQNQLDQQIAQLEAQQQRIQELQAEVDQANTEVQALTSIFNQIKPWSAMLQDIRERVPPGVQVSGITQNEIALEVVAPAEGEEPPPQPLPVMQLTIEGTARTFNEVNDFLLVLQRSNFLQANRTRLQSAQLTDNPLGVEVPEGQNIEVSLPEVIQYTILTEVSDIPASEILQELDRTGADGLVNRIRTLQQQGILEQ